MYFAPKQLNNCSGNLSSSICSMCTHRPIMPVARRQLLHQPNGDNAEEEMEDPPALQVLHMLVREQFPRERTGMSVEWPVLLWPRLECGSFDGEPHCTSLDIQWQRLWPAWAQEEHRECVVGKPQQIFDSTLIDEASTTYKMSSLCLSYVHPRCFPQEQRSVLLFSTHAVKLSSCNEHVGVPSRMYDNMTSLVWIVSAFTSSRHNSCRYWRMQRPINTSS